MSLQENKTANSEEEAGAVHELEVNFRSWVNFRDQQQGDPIRTFLREPMGEHITKSQSQQRCHCYGPVRAPASWCLGRRHGGDFAGASSGRCAGPGLASGLRFPARGLQRRAPVRVGAAAALGPGPSRSLLHRRRLPAAARCSRRARPRPIPPPTGTSPLSPQQTRKVRPSPLKSPCAAGRGALRGGVFLVPSGRGRWGRAGS